MLGAVPQPQPGGARVKAQAAQARLGPPWGSVSLGRRPWGQREGGARKGRRDLERQGQDLASILRGGHCRGVTAAGSPPRGHHRGVTAAGPRECCPLRLLVSTGQGEADPGEWAGERGPPRVWGVTAGGASCPGWSCAGGGGEDYQNDRGRGALGGGPKEAPGRGLRRRLRPAGQRLPGLSWENAVPGPHGDKHAGSDHPPFPRTLCTPGAPPCPWGSPLRGHLSLCPPCMSVFREEPSGARR